MLLPLLGACAVVGPFWGSEWEPVQGLLPQDCRCRDPRCCGNLLVLCLFLIWQVRHFWYRVIRMRSSKKNISKGPLQNWIVPPKRRTAPFEPSPAFSSPSHLRDLDAYIQYGAPNLRWRYQRSRQEAWAQCLFCPRHPSRGSPWRGCSLSELIFGNSSLSSTCLFPRNSSWESRHIPWCQGDSQLHSALHMWQRTEQLLVHSHEMLVPLEHMASRRAGATSTTFALSLPDLPTAQRLQACPRESLPGPSRLQLEMLTWEAWGSSQQTWTPWSDTLTVAREYSRKTQASESGDQKGREIQAPKGQVPTDSGIGDTVEAKALGCREQSLVIRETEGEIPMPKWENQLGVENRARAEELGRKTQRAASSESPPETQAYAEDSQAQLRCKTDVGTQTPEKGSQGKNRDEDAVQTQTYDGKNQKEAREAEEGERQARGLEKQGHPGGDNGEEALSPEQRKQNQMREDSDAETEAKEGRNKGQDGGGEAGGDHLEVKQQHGAESQAREWEKQRGTGNERVVEIQTPVREKGQGESQQAGNAEAPSGETWTWSDHATQVGGEDQGLGRGKDTKEPQLSTKKAFREIREVDWVVIKAPWWGNQRLVVSELNRELKTPCQWNQYQNQAGDKNRGEIQATEESEQRKGGDSTQGHEKENKGQFRGESDVETCLAGRNHKEWFRHGNGTDIQGPGKPNPGGTQGEGGVEIQEVGKESELGNEFHGRSYFPKCKNQEHGRGKDSANIHTLETETWGELTSEMDRETQPAERKKGEQAENGEEIQIPVIRNSRGAGGEAGTETGTAGEGSQGRAGCGKDRKSPSAEWENQEQRSEDGTEIQAPEKGKQRVPGGEGGLKTWRPERANGGQLENETAGCSSLGGGSWEQTGGENMAENQGSGKGNQKDGGSGYGRKIQRLTSKKLRLLKSKVNRKSCSSEWQNPEQIGGRNGAEIQIQGKRNLKGVTGSETQAPESGGQEQPRRQTDGETQTQRPRNQNMGAVENTAEIWGVGSQRKCRPEGATVSQAPRSGDKGQVRGLGAARATLQGDSCGGEGPTDRQCSPAQLSPLTDFGDWALNQAQTAAPCSEMKPRPHWGGDFLKTSGAGEQVARHGETRAETSPASQQPQPGSQRRRRRDKRVDPAKASGPTWQPGNPQCPCEPSACPSVSCGRVPHATRILTGASTVSPKGPVLKKSRRLLLESLMRRRIAHLKWGLPRRILESYLLFSFLGPNSMPLAGVRLPGLCINQELRRQQQKQCAAQGFTPSLESPKKPPRVLHSERKSSSLPAQARALEKHRGHGSAPMGSSTPPQKPRRTRPPGGARELQIPQAVPSSFAELWNGCGPERAWESSSGNSRGRTVVSGLGGLSVVSEAAERAPSRATTSSSRASHNYWKEYTSSEASRCPRLKSRHPTSRTRGSPEPVQGGGPGQQPPSCSPETSRFRGSLYSTATRLGKTLLSKRSWYPQLARSQLSAPDLSLLSSEGDPQAGEAALESDPQPPELCWAGAALPGTESHQGQGAPWNPAAAPPKFRFMKHLQCFFFQRDFKK
ncbi:uncharacterized protein LOC100717836 isoform X2 [Cavia porcellus]|uniref:uncharacterized protein LOC100717836 isoform X2 n=1 Tax=Cavia porcellus TaxID=10141 RepID=UPI002FE0140A